MAEQVRVVSPFDDPRYSPTPEQAAYELARRAAAGEVSPGSVSRTELAADVQASLAKADAALPATTASATYAAVVRPEKYGAVGDGVTDDTTAVQAAFAAAPAGSLVLLSGKYLISTAISVTTKVTVEGKGAFSDDFTLVTGFTTASTTIDVLSFTAAAKGSVLTNFGILNTSMPTGPVATAGAAVHLADATYSHVRGVHISGFWNGIQVDAGMYYTITECVIADPVNYGIYIRNANNQDLGDMIVSNNTISKVRDTVTRGTAVRWESGGGLRFIGNKINALAAGLLVYGLDLAAADGVNTGSMAFSSNSISNFTTVGIRLGQAGPSSTGILTQVAISGNDISYGNGTWAIQLNGAVDASACIRRVSIHGNTITSVAGGINLKNCQGILIGQNRIDATTRLQVDKWVKYIDVVPQLGGYAAQQDIINNATLASNYGEPNISLRHDYENGFALSAVNTWAQVFALTAQDGTTYGSSCLIEVTVSGGDSANGPFFARYLRSCVVSTGNVVTLATVDTDVIVGQIAVQFVPTGRVISVQVQVPNGAATPTAKGKMNCKVVGMLNKFHIGT